MWISLHLRSRPQVYRFSSTPPSSSSWCDSCHSPGSTSSDDELLVLRQPVEILDTVAVSRNPSRASGRIEPLTCRQSSGQALCCMWLWVCGSVHLCAAVCTHCIYETGMTEVDGVTGEALSFFLLWNRTHTLSNTVACRSTWRIRMLIHSLASPLCNLTTAHAVLDSFWRSLLYRTKSLCHSLESVFWIWQRRYLITQPWTKIMSVSLRLLYFFYSHYHTRGILIWNIKHNQRLVLP